MEKFCFKCGKKTKELINNYCEECFNKEFNLIKVPEKIKFTSCSKCDRIKFRNNWVDIKVEKILKSKIKILGRNIKLDIREIDNKIFEIKAQGYLDYSKKLKKEIYRTQIHLNKIVCPICTRKYGGYYEAILQLRGDFTEDILDFIGEQMIIMERRDGRAFYRTERVKNGIDFFIGNKSAANKLAVLLKKKFNAKIKKSYKLVTRKAGKNIYRTIISVKI